MKTASGEKKLALSDVSPDKCATCQYPTPLLYDVLVGEPIESGQADKMRSTRMSAK